MLTYDLYIIYTITTWHWHVLPAGKGSPIFNGIYLENVINPLATSGGYTPHFKNKRIFFFTKKNFLSKKIIFHKKNNIYFGVKNYFFWQQIILGEKINTLIKLKKTDKTLAALEMITESCSQCVNNIFSWWRNSRTIDLLWNGWCYCWYFVSG